MTDHSMELMNETLDVVKTNSEAIFNSGVIHGVTIVKNLITENEEVKDLDTLTQVLDLFIGKYDENSKVSSGDTNNENKEGNDETVPSSNIALEDLDDSEGNVYRGYIIPTYDELKMHGGTTLTIYDVDETERLDIGMPISEFDNVEDKDEAIKVEVQKFVDCLLNKDVLMMAKPKRLSDHYRQNLND